MKRKFGQELPTDGVQRQLQPWFEASTIMSSADIWSAGVRKAWQTSGSNLPFDKVLNESITLDARRHFEEFVERCNFVAGRSGLSTSPLEESLVEYVCDLVTDMLKFTAQGE